jgi:hypothetical protein
MSSAAALRTQIEAALADRIPSALTPAAKTIREVASTGIAAIDVVLDGGLPVGAVTEMIGEECSGRTALALSFLAQLTKAERVCAWIDVSNALSPESAAASGIDLKRLLWVRCGVQPAGQPTSSSQGNFALPEKYLAPPAAKRELHGGGFGPHPRAETKGLSDGVSDLLRRDAVAPRCAEPQRKIRVERDAVEAHTLQPAKRHGLSTRTAKPWSRIEQALRVADLLLQAGGFSAIVLDLGSIAPEHVSRIPLATWFRYGAAAERSRTSVLLLTQHAWPPSTIATRLATLATVPVKRFWIEVSPLSNGVPLWACAASGIISSVSKTKPERESRGTGLLTRAARWSVFMFAPPSDSSSSGMAQSYGANPINVQ